MPRGVCHVIRWDDDEEDQTKDKDKDNNQNKSKTNPSFSTAMTIILKPPKPFTTKFFDSMSSETPTVYTVKEKYRCDTIMAIQELYTTEHEVQDQDSLEDID